MPKFPGVNHQVAIRALGRIGYRIMRQGKHVILSNGKTTLVIPRANPINAFTMGRIIEDAGLTMQQFRELL